ncbi:MAG: 30S ribosomal protein S17 [Candidatus Komeilibacteria bacterium]
MTKSTTSVEKVINRRRFEGIVTSTAMAKTIVVEVSRVTWHPKYKKQYKTAKKFKAHDIVGGFQVGDKVLIEECRPISKDKKWRVIKKV